MIGFFFHHFVIIRVHHEVSTTLCLSFSDDDVEYLRVPFRSAIAHVRLSHFVIDGL